VELRTLRYFLAVADSGSVTAAATSLHVAQPSLSRQLRGFEQELGIRLFDRGGGRLRLSAGGRQFLPVAREVLSRAADAREVAASIAAGRLEQIRIAAPGTTIADVIAPFLATLSPDDPLPTVWAEVPRAIYDTLQRGADLVVGTEPPPARLGSVAVADLPVWAYVPAGHPWFRRDEVDLAELPTERLLVLTDDFHPRRALDRAAAEARVGYGEVLEFDAAVIAQALAAAGRGVAVVSDDPRFDLHGLRILGARRKPVHISLYAAWDPGHHAAAGLAGLAHRLSAFCIDRYGTETAPRSRSGR
jgi:DNA-binding transcriptional LysR family regulator